MFKTFSEIVELLEDFVTIKATSAGYRILFYITKDSSVAIETEGGTTFTMDLTGQELFDVIEMSHFGPWPRDWLWLHHNCQATLDARREMINMRNMRDQTRKATEMMDDSITQMQTLGMNYAHLGIY